MKKETPQSFRLLNITCPKIDFSMGTNYEKANLRQGYRGGVLIKDNKNVEVLFSVGLFANKEENDKENFIPTKVIVESVGFIEFKNALGRINEVNDIPMIANILAMLYPFLREKVNYCFSNNNITWLLPPLNVVSLLKDKSDSFKVVDLRKKKATTKKKLKKG